MGKRKGAMLSFIGLLFIFMLTTLFFFIVYCDHYNYVLDDFTGFNVDIQHEQGFFYVSEQEETAEEFESLLEDLNQWAKNNNAVVFYMGGLSAGIAAVDYAGWFERTWNTPFNGQEPKTAIVQKDNVNLKYFTEGDLLLPQIYNYRILGEFDGSKSPTLLQEMEFFYFPLSDITEMMGSLYTNVDDRESLAELTDIIEKSGRSAEYQTYKDSRSNIFEALRMMLTEEYSLSQSLLFAFLGLIFCAAFAVYMMYRESNRYLATHHLYGATYFMLFVKLIVRLICIAILGTVIGYILGRTQLYIINKESYLNIAILSAIFNVLFVCMIQIICFFSWRKKHHGKEGRY